MPTSSTVRPERCGTVVVTVAKTSYSSDGFGYYQSAARTVRLSLGYKW